MTVAVKNNNNAPLVVPPAIRRRARFKNGQQLEFRVAGGMISIIPKLPSADDEYTPEQRQAIDTRLAAARKGPYYGPFATADDAIKFLRTEVRKRSAANRKATGQ